MPVASCFRCAVLQATFALLLVFATDGAGVDRPPLENSGVYSCRPGPWGRVSWHYIHIEAPDWIVELAPPIPRQPAWCFPGVAPEELRTFLLRVGVSPEMANGWFSSPQAILNGENAATLFPSVADVMNLGMPARSAIYAQLGKTPQNPNHHFPLVILEQNLDDWLGKRALRPELRQIISHLSYLRGDAIVFSDAPVLLSHARDAAEALDLRKLLTRTRAIMPYLEVNERDDIPALESYWSAGRRRKDIVPMIESIAQLPGGGRLGLSHLLPAQPRKLIYTYPTPDFAAYGDMPDCHWTTLNFFNFRVKNVFLDERLAARQVLEGYSAVEPPYQFGDALIFITSDERAIHSCTYLCDDLVFTKNGITTGAPWIISRIEDVQRIYAQAEPAQVKGFRRRWSVKD